MKRITVILAMDSLLVSDAVHAELKKWDDIDVIVDVVSPIEILCRTESDEVDVVILEQDSEAEMPGVLTHLFAEFPRILAIVFDRRHNCCVMYRQNICKRVCENLSLNELLAELRTADAEYWVPG